MSNRFSGLPLQKKVALTLVLTISAFAAISYMILSVVILPAFDALELAAAKTDLTRAQHAITADVANLQAISADWALWDDIYNYAVGDNPAFYATNLERSTLTNLDLDMMAVFAADGRRLWSELLYAGAHHQLQELGILNADNPAAARLIQHYDAEDQVAGIINTDLGSMIISARPILRSDKSGPIAGALVVAQFLDDARLSLLQQRTEMDLQWTAFDEYSPTSEDARLWQADDMHIATNAREISSFLVLPDVYSAPALVLTTQTPRKISALGRQTVRAAMLFLLLAGVLVTVVMWYLLRRNMLRPIGRLAAHMRRIRESGDLSRPLKVDTSDEIGALANQFNRLTGEVHEARKALLFQSFKAGKADTAAEVLHNIRNAMTPMINGVDRLRKAVSVAGDLRVAEAVAELRTGTCPPPRAAKLVDYLEASFEHISATSAEAADDVKIVMSQARQIEAILSDQEKFASAAPLAENIAVDEVVGEAAHVIPKDAKKKIEVALDTNLREFHVHAHRIGLLQVLGNLMLNAYESIQRARRENGRIHLCAQKEVIEDRSMVRLTVTDNGTGFETDVRNRVFQRGFTSKQQGDTTGLGLHWCANAVAGMGGQISAESAGTGQGAAFHVLLPAAVPGVQL